jgi:alpha-D-xyloside xylohydrolase
LHERPNLPRTYRPSEATGLLHIEDRFGPDATEALYGLGQHQSGMFNYRGSVVELGQNNTDVAIPLLVSSKGYAILWNTASFSYFDNRFPLELNLESMAAPQIDYYILYGPQMDSIIHLYRSMTGHVPLFPEWAYGLFQSKDRYRTQQKSSPSRPNTVPATFPSTPSCRTGSGGRTAARATRSTTPATPMFPPN